jgi:hypothetical protein
LQWITASELEWAYQNREEYVGVCGEFIHVSEYPYILWVIRETKFTWEDCVDTAEVITRCQEAIRKGRSKEEIVEELKESNRIRLELL